jgi:hypothetical protein
MFDEYADTETDDEYHKQMFEYVAYQIGWEDAIELVAGNGRGVGNRVGIEAMQMFVHSGLDNYLTPKRPHTNRDVSSYGSALRAEVSKLPPREMASVLESELSVWTSSAGVNDKELYAEIEIYEVAEDLFGADLTDEITTAAQHLDESETKLDLLESRGAISGEEWYNRHEELAA